MQKIAIAGLLSSFAMSQAHAYREGLGGNRLYDNPEVCREVHPAESPQINRKFLEEICSEEHLAEVRHMEAKLAGEAIARKEVEAKRKNLVASCVKRNGLTKEGTVRLGMSSPDVRLCGWGDPRDINRSVGSWGVREQWVYGGRNYLYAENGKSPVGRTEFYISSLAKPSMAADRGFPAAQNHFKR